jgi:hypothetical protein
MLTNEKAATMSSDLDRVETQRYHLAMLRKAAQDIVDFSCSLQRINLQEFWLPCKCSSFWAHLSVPFQTMEAHKFVLLAFVSF